MTLADSISFYMTLYGFSCYIFMLAIINLNLHTSTGNIDILGTEYQKIFDNKDLTCHKFNIQYKIKIYWDRWSMNGT